MSNASGCDCYTCQPHESDPEDLVGLLPTPHLVKRLRQILGEHEALEAAHPLMIGYAIVLVLFLLFICWEDAVWHGSQRREEQYLKFTMILLFMTTLAAMLWSAKNPSLGMHQSVNSLIMLAILVHVWERHRKKKILERFRDNTTGASSRTKPSPKALRAIREVERYTMLLMDSDRLLIPETGVYVFIIVLIVVMALSELHESWIPYVSHYAKLVFAGFLVVKVTEHFYSWNRARPIHAKLMHRIKDVNSKGDPQLVEQVLEAVSVGNIIEVLEDDTKHGLVEGFLEAEMYTVRSKAILVDGLQKSGIARNYNHQVIVRRLILSCHGQELTRLKDLIDGGGDIHNLMKLIYFDMKGRDRDKLLQHIATEGQRVREQLGRSLGVKILSDVDDTLYCSGGKFPAGCDTEYPKHVVYPGCLALFRALDQAWHEGTSNCNMVFLSARPHIYKGIAEDLSYRLFRELVEVGVMHSMPTLLPGQKTSGLEAMLTFSCRKSRAWRKVGELKFTTYKKFMELYREYDFMFFGDNGQGDLLAGQLMAAEQQRRAEGGRAASASGGSGDEEEPDLGGGPRLRGVVIHEVMPPKEALALDGPWGRGKAWLRSLEYDGIFHHRSYIGAAVAIHKRDPELLPAVKLAEVARQAAEDLNQARVTYPEWGHRWLQAEAALTEDMRRAALVLETAELEPLPEVQGAREFLMCHSLTWPASSEEDSETSQGSTD